MTSIMKVKHECAVCGTENEYSEIVGTYTDGGPDLDLRPAEMKRSSMWAWLQQCPECGYVSPDIEETVKLPKEWLQSEEYLTCNGINFKSNLAVKFYKHFLISIENEKTDDALNAILAAAWACDDENDTENATNCRKTAIELSEELIREKNNLLLMKADLMRRTGAFDELIDEYSETHFNEDILNKILKFQIEKAKEKDDACYRVEDVIGK